MLEIKKLKELLAKYKIADKNAPEIENELIEYVQEEYENEKQTGISKVKKVNNEARNLREYKIALEKIGYDPESAELSEFLESLKTAKEASTEDKGEISKLQKTLEKLQKDFETKEKEAQELRDKTRRSIMRDALHKAIGDKVYGPQYVINDLLSSGKVALDDKENVVFVDGEDELEFDQGVKSFLENNADIVKNVQRPGGGSNSSSNTKTKYSSSDLDTMSVDEILANKDDVLSSLKAGA